MDDDSASACCASHPMACPFGKALLSCAARCELSVRCEVGEQALIQCTSPVARTNCETLVGIARERARFALKLPPAGRVLTHMQALRLQGGSARAVVDLAGDAAGYDVHRSVVAAHERHPRFADIPWDSLVATIAAWQPRRRCVGPRAQPRGTR